MTLRFDRFRHFPESGKTATLFLETVLGLILSFTDLHSPSVSRYFWSCFWISVAFDVFTILILLKEWDENVDWLRKAPYALYHSLAALVLCILFFVAGILFLASEDYSGQVVLYVTSAFCFIILGVRLSCVVRELPKVAGEARHPGRPSNADYENHGTSIV